MTGTWMWRQRPVRLLAVALLVALAGGSLVAVAARAQTPAFPASLMLNYSDSQGTGSVDIESQGADQTSGGTAITVTLTQNGMTYQGQGEGWTISSNAPRAFAVAFVLNDGNGGDDYFFTGTLQMGVDTFGGSGQWTDLQNPASTDQWRMFRVFHGAPVAPQS